MSFTLYELKICRRAATTINCYKFYFAQNNTKYITALGELD